ncbi:MAG: hypothetical protein M3083_14770 [Actinomycetota bacterium]|nr:hypothetical protein [Actinomycetota bacterium]MDQ6947176.1 hypothetical protein [Actinomycetota bacterium]
MGKSGATKEAPRLSPLGAVVRGALAGAVGTVALDAVNYAQYRAGGGTDDPLTWEFSAGLDSWEKAPAPAHVGKRLYEAMWQRELPPSSARTVNNVTHWVYGIFWGAQFGVVAASGRRRRLRGPVLGTLVWLSGYVVLPLAKLYQPIWKYDAKTLAKDWAGHLAYGTVTSGAFTVLSGGRRCRTSDSG